jgi:flagellar basal-body rod modification protein FlgD
MTDQTANVAAVAGSTVRPEWSLPTGVTEPTNELGKDEFLQLLVAQLKYQDPLEPTSSDEFIATSAQFTIVEKLDELTKQGENSALVNALTTAGSLIGREVTAVADGVEVAAVVERTAIIGGEVQLETTRGPLALSAVRSIGQPAAPEPTTPVEPSQPATSSEAEQVEAVAVAEPEPARSPEAATPPEPEPVVGPAPSEPVVADEGAAPTTIGDAPEPV